MRYEVPIYQNLTIEEAAAYFNNGADKLPYSISYGTISLTDLERYVDMTRKEILKKHKPAITHLQRGRYSGYYQTYIVDTLSGKRRNIRAKTREELDDKLVDFYSCNADTHMHTVEECYNSWISYLSSSKKPSTIHAYDKVFKRHFAGMKDKKIEELTPYDIKTFVLEEVKNKGLTYKSYSAMRTDILGIFHHAEDKGYRCIDIDKVMSELGRTLKGSFAKTKKSSKSDEDLVFCDEEVKRITDYCNSTKKLVDMGIILLFGSGVRVGELAALEKTDISDDLKVINVSKTEERIGNGAEYIISDTTKTDAGMRKVILTPMVSSILSDTIANSNPSSPYLFSDDVLVRYPAKKFRDRLYRICDILDIPRRSPHAIRRTYASKLFEAGIDETLIIKQMGHIDFDITRMFYIYNRKSTDELISELEKAL